MSIKNHIKRAIFPGLNLHARLRRRRLTSFLGSAEQGKKLEVLDVGCGNGMLSYESWKKGNQVTGISIKNEETERCSKYFNNFLGIPEERLRFQVMNILESHQEEEKYDEIICSEMLEHVIEDQQVVECLSSLLKPGGTLHLCCPNAKHPDNIAKAANLADNGGHVRAGYTVETYKQLLEPKGLQIESSCSIGGPIRQAFNKRIISFEKKYGRLAAVLVFMTSIPFLMLDSSSPSQPISVYVRAVKKQ